MEKARKTVFGGPNLLEIQSYCVRIRLQRLRISFSSRFLQLSILFMIPASNSMTQHIWTRIGVAIRYIQDVGAHRRMRQRNPTITDELWTRAAW